MLRCSNTLFDPSIDFLAAIIVLTTMRVNFYSLLLCCHEDENKRILDADKIHLN
jgi:hypothetical protein